MNTLKCIIATMIITMVILLFVPLISRADVEALPRPYVTTSDGGRFYFKMVPDTNEPWRNEKAFGILYKVTPKDTDEIVWKTKGWFSFRVYISSDGKYLVRMGDWPKGGRLSEDHLGIAFYKRGKLIKSYSTKDLVKDETAIKRTFSHYDWLNKIVGLDPDWNDHRFAIITIDNIRYVFDVTNGLIASQNRITE